MHSHFFVILLVFFGFSQNPDDKKKTSFTCSYGTYSYGHMHFGLRISPSTTKRCMATIFANVSTNC